MPWSLQRFQQARCLHFITCSCYHRAPLLASLNARRTFEHTLEKTRQWYGFYITGYVVMPEHFHLLLSEPKRGNLAVAMQMLKQNTSRQLRELSREGHFWQQRYYDFNVWSEAKRLEKLRYLHRNPVARGLVERPEDWEWSSFQHYMSGTERIVEIESPWTAGKRELQGWTPQLTRRTENPRPVVAATRTGHPIKEWD